MACILVIWKTFSKNATSRLKKSRNWHEAGWERICYAWNLYPPSLLRSLIANLPHICQKSQSLSTLRKTYMNSTCIKVDWHSKSFINSATSWKVMHVKKVNFNLLSQLMQCHPAVEIKLCVWIKSVHQWGKIKKLPVKVADTCADSRLLPIKFTSIQNANIEQRPRGLDKKQKDQREEISLKNYNCSNRDWFVY